MKWIIAIHDFGLGGSEKTVIQQANLLFERGHEVFFITMLAHQRRDLRGMLHIPDDHVLHFPFRSYFDLRSFPALVRFLRKTRPDVVLSASLFTNTLLKGAKLFYPSMKLVIREGNILRRHGWGSILFDQLTGGLVNHFITNARAIQDDLVQKLGIPKEKITVLYNGVDRGNTIKEKKPPTSEDVFTLLHIGSMNSQQKGQEYLIKALKDLPKNIRVMFIGDGHRKSEFETLSRAYGVQDRVLFLGKQKNPSEFMADADVFVFPSLWEGMPNALFEAMAYGLPVIATPVGGIPEVVEDNVSGFLIPTADSHALAEAVMKLYDDKELQNRLGESARQVMSQERFTWKYHLDNLISLCAGL